MLSVLLAKLPESIEAHGTKSVFAVVPFEATKVAIRRIGAAQG
jgi:hypothetical protein